MTYTENAENSKAVTLPEFEYVDVVGKGFEGYVNLFFGGWVIGLIQPNIATQMKAAIPAKHRSKDRNICFTCSGKGFSGAPNFKCGVCGTTATPPTEEQKKCE
jgi:hypothetical protein